MANKPFEYTIINPLERPTSSDINQLQAQAHYDSRVLANQLFAGEEGFLGDSFKAVPTDPASMNFTLSEGVLYTQGVAEDNIGAVAGLSDSYTYKATYLSGRTIAATEKPNVLGKVRWDLVQVKALSGADRMVDPATIGKFNPSLKSFTGQEVPKTLTSSLDGVTIEIIPYTGITPTANIVYKNGQEVTWPGSWAAVPLPDVDAGYQEVVYISRFYEQTVLVADNLVDARSVLSVATSVLGDVPVSNGGTGQTTLAAGEILLGNGTAGITSTAVLPVSKGGTGNGLLPGYMGSVAWFNTSEQKFKYTQAIPVGGESPVSGYLLASNATGAPTWIAPGSVGQVLVSTGTAWESAPVPGGGTSYSTSTTHTISASANFVEITCIGAGGGGGGGARSDTGGENGSGGGGGGGGGLTRIIYTAEELRSIGTSLVITIGVGGAGGAGAIGANSNGSAGTDGGYTSVAISTTQLAQARGGKGGAGGYASSTTAVGGAGGLGSTESGTAGGAGTPAGDLEDSGASYSGSATGGGAGGGWDGGPYALSGGSSGSSGNLTRNIFGVDGGESGDAGNSGAAGSNGIGGTGGGGGGAGDNANGGAGGAGGAAGGGGGGGGYCRKTNSDPASGGNGGNGGNGRVIIREW